MDQDSDATNPIPLSDAEAELLSHYRRCSPRRQVAICTFARNLAALEFNPAKLVKIATNIVQFKRRRDD